MSIQCRLYYKDLHCLPTAVTSLEVKSESVHIQKQMMEELITETGGMFKYYRNSATKLSLFSAL